MSYIPGISAQKESKHPFLTTGFLIVSDNPGEEKSRTEAFGAGVPGFGDKRAVFLRKEVGIYPKRPYVLEISSIVFPNISHCYSKFGLKGTFFLLVTSAGRVSRSDKRQEYSFTQETF